MAQEQRERLASQVSLNASELSRASNVEQTPRQLTASSLNRLFRLSIKHVLTVVVLLFALLVPTASAAEDGCVVMEVQSMANDDAASLAHYLSAKFSASRWAKELALLCVFETYSVLKCGSMPNVMAALPKTDGAVCSTPQSFADVHYWSAAQ